MAVNQNLARLKKLMTEIQTSVQMNQVALKGLNQEVVAVSTATTLTADQSGAAVYWTHSASNHDITLPAAKKGLNFKFVIAVGHAANHHITCAGTDELFGKVTVLSTTADKTDTQVEYKNENNFTELRLHASGNTLGGNAGDTLHLVCVEDGFWLVTAVLVTTGTAPAATVVMQA
tara:strand:- start:7111 stop:7635 length:525 start_codon:yes stop_codon:yes gene_type:complete